MSLVTAITPTSASRRWALPLAIRSFLEQTHEDRELVIVSDEPGDVDDLVPNDPRIRLLHVAKTLGEKRNAAIEAARGKWIAHFDDDDWRAADWLAHAVGELEALGAPLGGCRELVTYDLTHARTYHYHLPWGAEWWICGATLVYAKALHRRCPFPALNRGEDSQFTLQLVFHQHVLPAIFDPNKFVWVVHRGSTGRDTWNPQPPDFTEAEDARRWMGSAIDDYIAAGPK